MTIGVRVKTDNWGQSKNQPKYWGSLDNVLWVIRWNSFYSDPKYDLKAVLDLVVQHSQGDDLAAEPL